MIEISIGLLSPAEMNTLAGRTLELLQSASLQEPLIARAMQLIQSARENLQAVLNKDKGNPLTATVQEKDKERDKAFVFLRDFIKAILQHPDSDTADKAAGLWAYFEKHGTLLYQFGYAHQTSSMGLLFQDLDQAVAQEALQKLGASGFYETLKQKQQDFEAAYAQRTTEAAEKTPLPYPKEVHTETGRSLNDLFCILKVVYLTEEEAEEKAKVERLIAQVNEVIDSLMSVARARKTKNSKEEPTPKAE